MKARSTSAFYHLQYRLLNYPPTRAATTVLVEAGLDGGLGTPVVVNLCVRVSGSSNRSVGVAGRVFQDEDEAGRKPSSKSGRCQHGAVLADQKEAAHMFHCLRRQLDDDDGHATSAKPCVPARDLIRQRQ